MFIFRFFEVSSPKESGIRGIIVGVLTHLIIAMTTGFTIHNFILKLVHLPALEYMITYVIGSVFKFIKLYIKFGLSLLGLSVIKFLILLLVVILFLITFKLFYNSDNKGNN